MSIKTLLTDFYQILNEFNIQYCEDNSMLLFKDLFPLEEAIRLLSDEDGLWTYEIAPFSIILPSVQSHTFPHQTDISIVFQTHSVVQSDNIKVQNPINLRRFDIHLKGSNSINNSKTMASWHLDDQRQVSDAADGESKYLHPVFHFTFGGTLMEDAYMENWDFGQTLVMRSPRLMHPPMELILGIDFILNQFVAKKFIKDLVEKPEYRNIVKQIKRVIWKPYALAFAKNFCEDWATETQELTFDNDFCKSVIGKH
jgi:hypothetical protein